MLPKDIVRGMLSEVSKPAAKADSFSVRDYISESNCYSDERSMYFPEKDMNASTEDNDSVSGDFIEFGGESYYVIRNVDKMSPFFISIVSDSDHWMFVSSNGGLTAGRVSPDTALFPYVTVDKIHDSAVHTGCKTILQVNLSDKHYEWEPFNMEHDGLYSVSRHLYKNVLGD